MEIDPDNRYGHDVSFINLYGSCYNIPKITGGFPDEILY